MTVLLIILLVLTLVAFGLAAWFFTIAKEDVERLDKENVELKEKILTLEQEKLHDQRYFNRKLMETRVELNKGLRINRQLEQKHREDFDELRRLYNKEIEKIEHENFLMPQYRPFELAAA